jgi:hypothetical protein
VNQAMEGFWNASKMFLGRKHLFVEMSQLKGEFHEKQTMFQSHNPLVLFPVLEELRQGVFIE